MQRLMLAGMCLAASCLLATTALDARQPATKTIYVTVLDNKGAPITDLGPAELEAYYEPRVSSERATITPDAKLPPEISA